MAFLLNPNFGQQPGAPYGLNWWTGPRFNISDLMATMPPPPPPLAPSTTPQDSGAFIASDDMRSSGDSTGGGPGSLSSGDQTRALDSGLTAATTSPAQFDSRY